MRITGIEIFPLSVSFRRVIGESFGTVGKKEDDVVIRMHTDEGITGLGEGMTLGPFYSGESQETVIGIIANHLFPKVLEGEDPFNVDLIHEKMDRIVFGNSVAKAAVDFALHDIIGKSLGVPIYQLLGGSFSRKVPVRYGGTGIDTPEGAAALARQAVSAGFRGVKMKVGLDPRADVERVAAVREAVGPDVIIDVDANGGYLVKEAIEVLKRIEQFSPLQVEQPVRRDDLEGMALVRRSVSVPIGACEAALTLPQIVRIIKMEAADFFNYKIDRSGGFYRGKQAVAMIHAAGLFATQSEQLGFGIALAAQAHFAVSNCTLKGPAGIGCGLQMMSGGFDTRDVSWDIVSNTPRVEKGYLEVPEGTGLGVELSEESLEKYLTVGMSPTLVGRKGTV